MKKTLVILLALAMVLSMIPSAFAADAAREEITIRLSSDMPFTFDPATDEMAKFIHEKFGITFEDVPYEGDVEKMMLDAQSGTLADVFYTEPLYDLYAFKNLIDQGFVRSIPDELIAKYPAIKAQLENSQVAAAIREHFGANYALPKPDSLDPTIYISERKGVYFRKDWLAKVGMEIPTTWDEFYEVCKAFTLNDPDGNGANDTYGLTGDTIGNLRYFFSCLGHSNLNWVKGPDGTWIHGALLEDNIQLLEMLRKMFNEGLIDPEIGATKSDQAMQKFASGTFGMVIRNADASWLDTVIVKNFWEANKDLGNPYDIVGLIPALSLDKATPPSMDKYIDFMCATQISADLTDEKLDRYLEYHEWLLNEGYMLLMGMKDVDWKYDENGNAVKIRDANGVAPELAAKYPSTAVAHMASWAFEMAADPKIEFFDNFNTECKELNTWACGIRNANPVESDMRVKMISAQSMLDANSFKFTAEYWGIVSGTDPVDVMFKDMVKRAMESGFTTAIEDVNAICTEKGW